MGRSSNSANRKSRTRRPNTGRSYKTLVEIEKANKREFGHAAWLQGRCAVCGRGDKEVNDEGLRVIVPWEAHHVVEKKKLKAMGRQDLLWDIRNALRLCVDCHGGQTTGHHRIFLSQLTDLSYEFAWDTLGMEAAVYLRRYYLGRDARFDELQRRCDAALEEARGAA